VKILRRQRSAVALSVVLCVAGVIALLATLWKTWQQISIAKDPFSTFLSLLWTQKLDLIQGIEFRLVYLAILGDVLLIVGVVVYVLSVQWFYLPGKIVWYRCPFCNKDWRSTGDKALVHCPHCRQLVHPIMIEKPLR
jgi:hypothetical protein